MPSFLLLFNKTLNLNLITNYFPDSSLCRMEACHQVGKASCNTMKSNRHVGSLLAWTLFRSWRRAYYLERIIFSFVLCVSYLNLNKRQRNQSRWVSSDTLFCSVRMGKILLENYLASHRCKCTRPHELLLNSWELESQFITQLLMAIGCPFIRIFDLS
jgi:hypothetical protein